MKTEKLAIRQIYRNLYIFEEKVWMKDIFIKELHRCMQKYNPHGLKGLRLDSPLKDGNADERNDAFASRKEKFRASFQEVCSFSSDLRSDFFQDIRKLAHDSGLGDEWLSTLVSVVIDHWLFPPIYNLHIQADEKKKRVVLELNPDTSLDDIKVALAEIQYLQRKLSPDFKKHNFTDNSFRNLGILKKDLLIRTTDDDVELNDLDIAGRIWSNEEDINEKTDKKRVYRLRQTRHRLKKSR